MSLDPYPPIRMAPVQVAPDTFLIRSAQPALGAPLAVNLNSLVIRADEPVIVDTGTIANRTQWLDDVFSLVEPDEVRWIYISHDDDDHVGNLAETMERCPNATLVVSWAATERMGASFGLPPERLRWVDDGGTLEVGDRTLRAIRPPVYDSPTTRGLFDPTTRVYWASDAFATPMPGDTVDDVEELSPTMWAEGMAMFHHHALCPWLSIVDESKYRAEVSALRSLSPEVVVSAHSPIIRGEAVGRAFDLLAALPSMVPPPHPDQQALTAIVNGPVPA
ncbi:MAG: MBL fold metallo-hydrolase [Acidimicrobiales bacterium]